MIEYMFVALLLFTLAVGVGFIAGYLAGRATERIKVEDMINSYYEKCEEWIGSERWLNIERGEE